MAKWILELKATHGDNATRNLAIVQDVVVQSEIVGLFVHPVKWDEDGNVR